MAQDGAGTILTFTGLTGLVTMDGISGPSEESEPIESTTLGTTSTTRTYIPQDLKEGGEVSGAIDHSTTGRPVVGSTGAATIAFGGSTSVVSFAAILTAYNPTAATGERMTADFTLKVAGPIT